MMKELLIFGLMLLMAMGITWNLGPPSGTEEGGSREASARDEDDVLARILSSVNDDGMWLSPGHADFLKGAAGVKVEGYGVKVDKLSSWDETEWEMSLYTMAYRNKKGERVSLTVVDGCPPILGKVLIFRGPPSPVSGKAEGVGVYYRCEERALAEGAGRDAPPAP